MKIADTYKVGGHIIEVVKCKNIEIDGQKTNYLGMAVQPENKIYLATEYLKGGKIAPSVIEETVVHELLHLVDIAAGTNLKESQVNAIASGMYQILKDNKVKF